MTLQTANKIFKDKEKPILPRNPQLIKSFYNCSILRFKIIINYKGALRSQYFQLTFFTYVAHDGYKAYKWQNFHFDSPDKK